jgi:hypothetical protein
MMRATRECRSAANSAEQSRPAKLARIPEPPGWNPIQDVMS